MITCLALCLALLAPGDADQARALYQAGGRAYRAGNYDIAIDAFASADRLSERAVVVFALAQAYRLRYFQRGVIGDLEAAIAAYQRYLIRAPQGSRNAHATQHIAVLTPLLERKRIEATRAQPPPPKARLIITSAVAAAEAWVDAGDPRPVPAAFEVEPGPHTIAVRAPGHRVVEQETVAVADTAVAVGLDPRPIPGTLQVDAPRIARLHLDGVALSSAAQRLPVEVAPGPHVLLARAPGHRPQQVRFAIASGRATRLDVDLEPTTQRLVAWGALGAAGLLAAGGVVTGAVAWDAQRDAQHLETALGRGITGDAFAEHDRLRARRDTYADATLALGISAGVALVAGALLWLFDDPAAPLAPLEAGPAEGVGAEIDPP